MTVADPMQIGTGRGSAALDEFIAELSLMETPRVLELGTLQSERGRATHHGEWLPAGATHVMSDVAAGPDVDVVADAHRLAVDLLDGGVHLAFDVAIAVSVWEHLRLPWVCAQELRRCVRPGALVYVATHHAFPVHGYPSDFTRWTDDGLAALFDAAGFTIRAKSYAYPCQIVPGPEVTRWNPSAPAYLNVDICAVAL